MCSIASQESSVTERRHRVAVIAYDEPFVMPTWVAKLFERARVEFTARNCQNEQETVTIGKDKDILLTSSARRLLTAQAIEQLEACRGLVRIGSGVDCIDVGAATARGIVVVNTPEALASEVAEHALALMLCCRHRLAEQDVLVKKGLWEQRTVTDTQRVRGKTLGLIGFGRIAQALVKLSSGLSLSYLAVDPGVDQRRFDDLGVARVNLEQLLEESSIVSIHVPLTDATYHLIGEEELRLMKPSALLINTARGAVVDQAALCRALSESWIAGAGLDVTDPEPPSADDPLLQFRNVIFTPHSAAFSYETRDAMYRAGCKKAIDLLAGRLPLPLVNPDVNPWWLSPG